MAMARPVAAPIVTSGGHQEDTRRTSGGHEEDVRRGGRREEECRKEQERSFLDVFFACVAAS
jgi:hypothetical protein